MTNPSTISNLPTVPLALTGAEFIPLVQNGVTYKALLESIPFPSGGTPPVYVGGISTGSANAQAVTVIPTNYAFLPDNIVILTAGFTNTGSMTLNVENTGAKNVQKITASGLVSLTGGEVVLGGEYMFAVNGSVYQLINPFPIAGDASSDTVIATGSSVSRTLANRFASSINVLDYGAVANDSTNNDAAFAAAFNAAKSTRSPLYIPEGTYKFANQIVWDFASVDSTGLIIYGDGQQNSILDVSSVITSPNVLLEDSSNDPNGVNMVSLRDFMFLGNIAGVVTQVGQSSYSDAFAHLELWNVESNNASSSSSAVGMELNSCYACNFNILASSQGGVGLKIRQVAFSTFYTNSAGGPGVTGMYLTNGSIYGNVFFASDFGATGTCVQIDSAGAKNNTWIGGIYEGTIATVNATAGSSNYFINSNFGSATGPVITSGTGVVFKSANQVVTTPSFPLSGGAAVNGSGMAVRVMYQGSGITNLVINSSINITATTGTVIMNPGDSIVFTYTGSPTWVWTEIY